MEIVWTKLAHITYFEILQGLEKRWTIKELRDFVRLTDDILVKIKTEKIIHPCVNEKIGIHKGIIHKNVSLFYREDKTAGMIYLITFFNNRMDPDTLRDLLNS